MKTSTLLEFPKGNEEALLDLDSWLREFDRVVAHVSSNKGLMAEDRIAHLLSCWGAETDVGENMRMDQQSTEYLVLEAKGEMEKCWSMLLARLNKYRVEPAEARRREEAQWAALYWPGDLDAFHTMVRRAVTALRKAHTPLADHSVVFKYLELLPKEKAIALDDPLRRPAMGWTADALMQASKELFSLERAYDGSNASGLPKR